MTLKNIPSKVFDILEQDPTTSGAKLFQMGAVPSERTGRRWKGYFKNGKAVRDEHYFVEEKVTFNSPDYVEESEEEIIDLDELIAYSQKLSEIYQKRDPLIKTCDFDFPHDEPIAVMFASCFHLGGRYTAYHQFEEIFNEVLNTPRLYFITLGDEIEGFLSSFKDKKAIADQLYQVPTQVRIMEKVLDQLRDKNKLLAGVAGQHGGWWMAANYTENPIKRYFLESSLPYFDGMGYARFKFKSQTYRVAMAHKFKGSSMWNPHHAQMKAHKTEFPSADLVVMGDKHTYGVQNVNSYSWEYDAGERESDRVLLVQVGTAKTGPDEYTIKGWSTGRLGWPAIIFDPNDHCITYTETLSHTRKLLGV